MNNTNYALIEFQLDVLELQLMGLTHEEILGYIDFYSDIWTNITKDLLKN